MPEGSILEASAHFNFSVYHKKGSTFMGNQVMVLNRPITALNSILWDCDILPRRKNEFHKAESGKSHSIFFFNWKAFHSDLFLSFFPTPDFLGERRDDLRVCYFRCDENIGILSPLAHILIVGLMGIKFDDGTGIKI